IDMSGRDHCKYISEILYTYKNEVLFEGKTIPKYRSYSAETKKLKSEIISEIKTKKPLLNMDKEILCSRDSHPFAANLSDRCWENK
ncbi:MAG: hypothetical protein M0R03_23470, partial [Novosphingobium sp.]|nr:hypothetical protein [Novosphingobium sp.]